ncbi:unnamed protein product [Rodentolepis nana]|uniref:Calcium homeostasis endoplasmic reticulum protein n=1 Tax=Rodentolepis nana TaxID=102285 RepID=A0A0R3T386_RODNA|nr:unnamed protein product [Rodentolepis nana]
MSQTDMPEPPADPHRRDVIDKLAQFVARNGPEFERMTMEKQHGNPDFEFLSGGEFSDYYKHKVEEFRMTVSHHPNEAMSHQQPYHHNAMPHQQWGGPPFPGQGWNECDDNWNNPGWQYPPTQGNWGPNWGPQNGPPPHWYNNPYPPNFYPTGPYPSHQGSQLTEDDVKRSEMNLKAQYDKIIGEELPIAIKQRLDRARMEAFIASAARLSFNPEEISAAIQPIIEACTKENIARGKNFSVETMSKSDGHANLLADYLLLRVQASEASFETRLYIIYLINDLLHYLKRHPDTAHFLPPLSRVVVPIYALALDLASEEKKEKLTRVLNLWESNSYLTTDVLKNMKEESDRKAFMDAWNVEQDQLYAEKVAQVEAEHQARYESLKKQHDDFADHVRKSLSAPLPMEPDSRHYGPPLPPGFNSRPPSWGPSGGYDGPPMQWHGPPPFRPGPHSGPPDRWRRDMPYNYPPDDDYYDGRRSGPQYRGGGPHRDRYRREGRFDEPPSYYEQDRPSYRNRRRFDSDGSSDNPRPRRNSEEVQENCPPPMKEEDLVPKVPFWQLPAGLMHPLVKAKDFDFIPLDPSKLRLLAPKPPSEQLMQAIDAYYSQPSHDRPRDQEGWERLGLYEFYRSKEDAKNGKTSGSESPRDDDDSDDRKNGSEGSRKMAYLTAYPKSAIGQAIRTGPVALIGVPPPNLLLPKMNAQFAALAAATAINNAELKQQQQQLAPPVPPTPSMMSQPPPGMVPSIPPTSSSTMNNNQQQLVTSRPSRFTSAAMASPPSTRGAGFRRSRSRSRSYSGSRSRSRSDSRSTRSRSRSSSRSRTLSRSRSRSRSRSSRSRTRSPPSERRYRDRSRSPRSGNEGSITTAGYMRRNAVGSGGGDQRNHNRRGGMGGNNYAHPPSQQQWDYDHGALPPPHMMSPYDRRTGHPPPGPMYPPFGGGGGFRGNNYTASPQSHQMGNGPRGGGPPFYGAGVGGGNSYGNPNRRGYQGR